MPDGLERGAVTSHDACGLPRRAGRLAVVAIAVAAATAAAQQQTWNSELGYQKRGSHREGLENDFKTNAAIRLISAVADVQPREAYTRWPPSLRLRFYLPHAEKGSSDLVPDVRIRQTLSPRGYYALDSIEQQTWMGGGFNEYQWPSDTIVKVFDYQYPGGGAMVTRDKWIADLGVVVWLSTKQAGRRQSERVAPAALYHAIRPSDVVAYQFTFRTTAPAEVTSAFHAGQSEVFVPPARSVDGGSLFTIRWTPAATLAERWYSLTVDATFQGGYTQAQSVEFYHKRSFAK